MICGVGHLHSVDLVHGDLSAANILIGRDGRAIVGDLGTAHSLEDRQFHVWDRTTHYIRAPEYWLEPSESLQQIDIWALGVITALLVSGKVLFVMGNAWGDEELRERQPIAMIQWLGPIEEASALRSFPGWTAFAAKYAEEMASSEGKPRKTFRDLFVAKYPCRLPSDPCHDVITSCLRWDPFQRLRCHDLWLLPLFESERLSLLPGVHRPSIAAGCPSTHAPAAHHALEAHAGLPTSNAGSSRSSSSRRSISRSSSSSSRRSSSSSSSSGKV